MSILAGLLRHAASPLHTFFIPRLDVFFLDLLTLIPIPSDSSFNRRVPPFLFLLTPFVSLHLSSPSSSSGSPLSHFSSVSLSFPLLFADAVFLSLHLSLSLAVPFLPQSLPSSFPGDSFSLSFIFLYLLVIAFLGACPAFSLVQFSPISPRLLTAVIRPHLLTVLPSIFLSLFCPFLLNIVSFSLSIRLFHFSSLFPPPPMQW